MGGTTNFLRDEFYRYGAENWSLSPAIRPSMTVPGGTDNARFIGKHEVARILNVSFAKVCKMCEENKLDFTTSKAGAATVYVFDRLKLPKKTCNRDDVITRRKAAVILGVPTAVLRDLEKAGIYKHALKSDHYKGFHIDDLEKFKKEFLTLLSKNVQFNFESGVEVDLFTLLFSNSFLRTSKAKIAFMVSLFKAETLPSKVSGSEITDVKFSMVSIESFRNSFFMQTASEEISAESTLKFLDFPNGSGIVESLIEQSFLEISRKEGIALYVTKKSVTIFKNRYVSLRLLAMEVGSSAKRLHHICKNNRKIEFFQAPRKNGQVCSFIHRKDIEELKVLERLTPKAKQYS